MLSQYLRLFTQSGNLPDGDANTAADPLTDVSLANQDGSGILFNFNYLYIAQHYPFVNLFMLMDQINQAFTIIPTVTIPTPYDGTDPGNIVHEVQHIAFTQVPDDGVFNIEIEGSGVEFDQTCTAAEIEDAFTQIAGLENITVAGDFENGFDIALVDVANPALIIVDADELRKTVSSKFKIEYWDGTEWRTAVDVIDGSRGLYQHGMIQFNLHNRYQWCEVPETDDDTTNCPKALVGRFINNCYWLRLSPITTGAYQAPNPLTKIKRLCYAFTTTEHINSIDVEAPNYYDSIEDGKTSWVEEIIHASEEMVLDLKRIGFIKSAGQIIELDELYLACAWKTLAHIYFNLGKAYTENRAVVTNKYEKALSSKALTFDNDGDGRLKRKELQATTTKMVR